MMDDTSTPRCAATSTPLSTNLKSYPEYKDSGLPWLGKVPGHWKPTHGFAAFREKQVKNIGLKEKRVLSLSYGRIVVKPEGLRGLMPDSFETYQIVVPGDIIIRSTDLQNDKTSLRIGVVRDRGIITSAYICMKTTEAVLPEFGFQLLNTYDLSKVLYGMGSGLRQNLAWSDFKRMPVFLPPLDEQAAIVRFLDHATHQLDKAIRAKRKTIALLNEQKQAIIHRAITRGLAPDIPLKDSGIPWLGDIPVGWETMPIKRIASVLNGFAFSSESYIDSGIPLVRIGDVKSSGAVDIEHAAKLSENYLTSHSFVRINNGDLVMAMTGATIGKVAIYLHEHPALLNQRVCAFRCRIGRVKQDYLFLLLSSKLYLQQVLMACYGGAQPNISDKSLADFKMPVAPFELQDRIVSFVAGETKSLNTTISRFEREIELLREYRTRLIADVVTGKLDVREAAASLPEVEEAPAAGPELAEMEVSGEELAEEDA